ncbi:unnamed protein product [Chrysodeixis includens]|uniref:chitinase n=1 Tax=Chrysodeixis includens TaxID=689277 RepID=A0A9N8KWG3_CHRIL|nr:unnamed protein product [Chrysodeixis includens]
MAASASSRKNFIDSSLSMITKYGFDGLDIDWEYPSRRDTVYGSADIDNFTTLLKEFREAFDKKKLLLTAAVSSVREAASQSYNVTAISQYLDIVNIMTYDMHGSWDAVTGHNSPLFKGEGDEGAVAADLYTIEQALAYWIGAGCPPEKIAVGVPFYGRTFTLSNANVNGVRAAANGAGIAGPYTATNGFLGYNEFCNLLQTESWTQRYDQLAKVPYAFKDYNWVTYDDANSIALKVDYAKSLGIDKIMIWSIETDDFHGLCGYGNNPLLNAINLALDSSFTTNRPSSTSSPDATTSNSDSSSSSATSSSSSLPIPTPAASVTPATICKGGLYVPKPGDCTSFYMCVVKADGSYEPLEVKCSNGLHWDQTILACNYPSEVKCKA